MEAKKTWTGKPILVLDFDGVIHGYQSGWKGADVVPDPPVPGALEFILKARDHFEVHIFSSRSKEPGAIAAMQQWLLRAFEDQSMEQRGFLDTTERSLINEIVLSHIQWPVHKPPAHMSIDDRGFQFNGEFPPVDYILQFKPWNKRG